MSSASNPDGEYVVDALVTPRADTESAIMTADVVFPGATPYHSKVYNDGSRTLEAQIESKKANFEDSRSNPEIGDNRVDFQKENEASRSFSMDWFIYTIIAMTLVLLTLVGYGFGSGLYLPKKNPQDALANDVAASGIGVDASSSSSGASSDLSTASSKTESLVNRQDYKYSIVTLMGLPLVMESDSAKAQAVEWLAFKDVPLFDPSQMTLEEGNTLREILSQRYALVVWYFDQGGPTVWTTLNREASSGWIEFGAGVHECDWKGVDCDYQSSNDPGTVVGLRLSPALGLVLTGSSLSTELGLLTGLRYINFSDQRLQGTIPDEWSALSNLELVVLSKNELQSTIPEWIEGWTNLEHLALDGNLFYGTLPSSLSTLQNLKHLDLDTNPQLRGRFDDVLFDSTTAGGPKRSLEHLDLSNTDLEGELPKITLPYLTSLRLWDTRGFGGRLPPEIGSWSNLETFSINESPKLFGSIPTEFGLLENLRSIEVLYCNNMSGELPTELGNLSSNLTVINFQRSNVTGRLPLEWANLKSLERMDLHANEKLGGTIPPEYSNLTSLRFLDLRATNLSGEVPDGICALENLLEINTDCGKNEKTLGKITCDCCTWCHNA